MLWILYSFVIFKGAVCRIVVAVELGIAVQIQNIGDVFFHQPLLLRLDAQVARLTTPTGTSAHDDECFVFRCVSLQLATRGAEIQLGKLAVGGFHKPKQTPDIPAGTHIFKGE